MSSFSSICIMWISVCVDALSAEPEISVSGPVGSTTVLPCELPSVDSDNTYIRWNTESEILFERLGERSYQGEGYEGRVNVSEEELHKGNCSLVLHNLRLTDAGVYTSYARIAGQSLPTIRKERLINHINLSVNVPPKKTRMIEAASTVMKSPLFLVLFLISFLFIQLFCG